MDRFPSRGEDELATDVVSTARGGRNHILVDRCLMLLGEGSF